MLNKKKKNTTREEKFYSVVLVILYIIIAAVFGFAAFIFLKDFFGEPINYIGTAIVLFVIIAIICEGSR